MSSLLNGIPCLRCTKAIDCLREDLTNRLGPNVNILSPGLQIAASPTVSQLSKFVRSIRERASSDDGGYFSYGEEFRWSLPHMCIISSAVITLSYEKDVSFLNAFYELLAVCHRYHTSFEQQISSNEP